MTMEDLLDKCFLDKLLRNYFQNLNLDKNTTFVIK